MPGKDQKIYFSDKITMTGNDKPKSDFIYVACEKSSWLPNVYSMYHAFAQKNPNVRMFRVSKNHKTNRRNSGEIHFCRP